MRKVLAGILVLVLATLTALAFVGMPVESEAATKLPAPKIVLKDKGVNSVLIKWNPVSKADGYIIYKYDSGKKKYITCGTVSGEITDNYTVSGLKSGKTYKFKIAAYINKAGKKSAQTKTKAFKIKTLKAAKVTDYDISYQGVVTATVNVRKGPGTKYDIVYTADGQALQLKASEEVVIIGEGLSDEGTVWYHIQVNRGGVQYEGYSTSSYIGKGSPINGDEPSFDLPDFYVYDESGRKVRLSDYFGKPIIVNYWATWCGPCVRELPDFDKLYGQYGNKVQFLMVNGEDRSETDYVKQFMEYYGFTFPIYYDYDNSFNAAYGTGYIPVTVAINKKGEVIYHDSGSLDEASLEELIEKVRK